MSDPIPSGASPDEPVRKSGFNPAEYEAEQAEQNESSRLHELPPKMRMYRDVMNLTQKRLVELYKSFADGTYRGRELLQKRYEHRPDPTQQHRLYFDEVADIGMGYHHVRIESLGNDSISLDMIELPVSLDERHPDNQAFVVVIFEPFKADRTYVCEEDLSAGAKTVARYALVLSAEMEPVIIYSSHAVGGLKSEDISSLLTQRPNHAVSDEECKALLRAIATAPV
ncbi:MAG: hypothetical protein QG675_692 [Patescibacteria group bacterium]|jgi:hypothetical protein|nr:hypothetical protein [Patescibacteria group bacterium]